MSIIRIVGSLYFAVFLIATLAVVLTISTTLESFYGTPFAQKYFYQSAWFDVFLAMVGVNLFCSTLLRLPFKRQHTGFVVTHIGILMVLAGSLLSRLLGIDGNMLLVEGQTKNEIVLAGDRLTVHHGGRAAWLDLGAASPARLRRGFDLSDTERLSIDKIWTDAVVVTDILPGAGDSPANPAIELALSSEAMAFKNTFWLIEKNPLEPSSDRISLGPAVVQLKKKKAGAKDRDAVPTLRVKETGSSEELAIDLTRIPPGDIPLGKTGIVISNLLYYPDARVSDNRLVSISEKPLNPAVSFDAVDPKGRRENHKKFALFPEFESLHGKNSALGLTVELSAPAGESGTRQASLNFFPPDGGRTWSYESLSSRGKTGGGIEAGKTYPAGWVDFSFRVEKLLERAVVTQRVAHAKETEKGRTAVEVSLVKKGSAPAADWVFEENPVSLHTENGHAVVEITPRTAPVPFKLNLKDFRKVDYPGTRSAASYESDVALFDPAEKITIEKTIRMNQPLDYKGYRIFQSSFIQDPDGGEASVFTVAKNPGITLIYVGSCVLFLGVLLVFYVRPLSSK
ncbi:MAG: cytochrome c biogenesis protein ResB [Candidatus Omnitrophica bacterium]|nr:cytochrome c biogenesis protein ResB [Candidatus Omnitrophota bacterium]